MTRNGGACIFRMTGATDTEANLSDKIDFTVGGKTGKVPNEHNYYIGVYPTLETNIRPIGTPGTDAVAQDSGLRGIPIAIRGFLDERSNYVAEARLAQWMLQQKTYSGVGDILRKGRFGFRDDTKQIYNVLPDQTAGYILLNYTTNQDPDFDGKVSVDINLLYNGDPAKLGAYTLTGDSN